MSGFKVGDAVVFEHKNFNDGQPVKGVISKVGPPSVIYLVTADLGNGVGRAGFTADGRFNLSEEPSLRLASETTTWTVILLYPDYMTDDFGADIYVDCAEADDPYEAVKLVQEMAAAANSGEFTEEPGDFRCIGVLKGEHTLELDATNF